MLTRAAVVDHPQLKLLLCFTYNDDIYLKKISCKFHYCILIFITLYIEYSLTIYCE